MLWKQRSNVWGHGEAIQGILFLTSTLANHKLPEILRDSISHWDLKLFLMERMAHVMHFCSKMWRWKVPILQRGALPCRMLCFLCFYVRFVKVYFNIYATASIKDQYKIIYWYGTILVETLANVMSFLLVLSFCLFLLILPFSF